MLKKEISDTAVSSLDFHCLQLSHKTHARFIWVYVVDIFSMPSWMVWCVLLFLSVTAYNIALLHVGLINVVYFTACAFIRSS